MDDTQRVKGGNILNYNPEELNPLVKTNTLSYKEKVYAAKVKGKVNVRRNRSGVTSKLLRTT